MKLVAGIDGGGTGSRALVLDQEGNERGRGEGPPGIVTRRDLAAGVDRAADAVEKALGAARSEVGPNSASHRSLMHLCVGLAGAGDEEVRAAVRFALEKRGLAEAVSVTTDVEVAYRDAFPHGGPGILLVAGTGSMALGRGSDGEVARAGGWGAVLDDAGSGYRIGLDALRAVLRSYDGRSVATRLTDPVLSAMGVSSPEELVSVTERASKARIAGIAPLVLEIADSGDPAAEEIVDEALGEMTSLVEAVASRISPSSSEAPSAPALSVALHGGLIAAGGPLHGPLRTTLEVGGFVVLGVPVIAARGAALLALERSGGG